MKDIRHLSKEEKVKIIQEQGKSEVFDLEGADLEGADLRYTNLRYTNLRGADLREADLRYTDLRGAKIDETTIFSKMKINKDQAEILMKKMFDIQEAEEE